MNAIQIRAEEGSGEPYPSFLFKPANDIAAIMALWQSRDPKLQARALERADENRKQSQVVK